MARIMEWIFAWIGALICGLIAVAFWQYQQGAGGPIWPLPAAVLLEVALLGIAGLISITADTEPHPQFWGLVTWFVTGVLAGLMILGGFSIGPYLFPAVVLFASAALLADRRRRRRVLPELGSFAIGTLGSILLLLFLNVLFYGRI
jgi:hypothetical protein